MKEQKEQNSTDNNGNMNNDQGTNNIEKSKTSLVKWLRIGCEIASVCIIFVLIFNLSSLQGKYDELSENYRILYEEINPQTTDEEETTESTKSEEQTEYYSAETDTPLNKDYPYAVLDTSLELPWDFSPLVKQKNNCPTWIIANEADTLDEPPYANLFIDDSSANYTFNIEQVATKEITVQDENRELQTAKVNTQVTFKHDEEFGMDDDIRKNERPGYFFVDQNGYLCLALQSYDDEDFYILYG